LGNTLERITIAARRISGRFLPRYDATFTIHLTYRDLRSPDVNRANHVRLYQACATMPHLKGKKSKYASKKKPASLFSSYSSPAAGLCLTPPVFASKVVFMSHCSD